MPYHLFCAMYGHTKDVRAVATSQDGHIISGSRDFLTKVWKPGMGGFTHSHTFSGQENYVISVAIMPPCEAFPTGLIATGGYDNRVYIYNPENTQALFILEGHSNAVTSIFTIKNDCVLTASCDGSAKVWSVFTQSTITSFPGHELPVWSAIYLDDGFVITACADRIIRVFLLDGVRVFNLEGHSDCVRSLEPVDSSGFLSAGNDGKIKRWNAYTGTCLETLSGHSSFVYSLALSRDKSFFVSAGEDRCLLVWDNNKFESIKHPSQSIWAVAILPNNDIVTGSSDGVIRVFSKNCDRIANAADLATYYKELEDADNHDKKSQHNQNSSVPEDSTANIGTFSARGDAASNTNSAGSQPPTHDYIFTIDVEDGKPPLNLYFNKGEDPYEVAQKFIEEHGLMYAYLQQITDFIKKNTQPPVSGLRPTVPSFADPFTGESRYIPGGERGEQQVQTTSESLSTVGSQTNSMATFSQDSRIIPHTEFVLFETANVPKIKDKILEFSPKSENGICDIDHHMVDSLIKLCSVDGSPSEQTLTLLGTMLNWPKEKVFPVLDITRLAVRNPLSNEKLCGGDFGKKLISVLKAFFLSESSTTNKMLSLRVICNMMRHPKGEELFEQNKEDIIDSLHEIVSNDFTKPLQVAVATLLLNISVLFTRNNDKMEVRTCLQIIQDLLKYFTDDEAIFRTIISLGTCVASDCQTDLIPATLTFLKSQILRSKMEKIKVSSQHVLKQWEAVTLKK